MNWHELAGGIKQANQLYLSKNTGGSISCADTGDSIRKMKRNGISGLKAVNTFSIFGANSTEIEMSTKIDGPSKKVSHTCMHADATDRIRAMVSLVLVRTYLSFRILYLLFFAIGFDAYFSMERNQICNL